jgi:hypothetical protein
MLLLSPTAKFVLAIIFIVGLNVFAYFVTHVWNKSKHWFFYLLLVVTLLFFGLVISSVR